MLNSRDYALQYFDEKDDRLFALITAKQWLEFANQYGMYVSQNSGNTNVLRSLPSDNVEYTQGWKDGFESGKQWVTDGSAMT